MKSWKTTLFGVCAAIFSALSVEFPEQKEIFVSLAALAGSLFAYFAKDSDVSGTAKTIALFLFLSLGNFTEGQTTNVDFTGLPAAGTKGMIQINGYGGLLSADSLLIKNDTTITIISTNQPNEILSSIGINSFKRKGICILTGDTTNFGSYTYDYNSNTLSLSGISQKKEYYFIVQPSQLYYKDTSEITYDLLTGGNIEKNYSKTKGGRLNSENAILHCYGNGSTAGIDTIYLTDNGLENGNDLFRTVYTDECIFTVNSVNDSMLIAKVVTFYTSNAPKYVTIKMKYLTGAGTFANVPNGTKAKAIIVGVKN